ncbi:hypothetical protein L1887_11312 [Cichorium endivia]|nr:hypothetical protein L1887_11312 [Cichorium endivia]
MIYLLVGLVDILQSLCFKVQTHVHLFLSPFLTDASSTIQYSYLVKSFQNFSNASIYEVLRTLKVVLQQEAEQSEYGFIAHLMKSEVYSSLDSSRLLLVLRLWISPLNIVQPSSISWDTLSIVS